MGMEASRIKRAGCSRCAGEPALMSAASRADLQRILRSSRSRPRLRIGAADVGAEKEADRVADVVTSGGPAPRVASVASVRPALQRRCCATCDSEETIQPKADHVPDSVSGETAARIQGLRGGGRGLSASERAFYEPRFGRRFDAVRLHTGAEAAALAKRLNAQAFTLGRDIVWGGDHAPASTAGRHLLAHELTHVIQQSHGQPRLQRKPGGASCPSRDDGEQEQAARAPFRLEERVPGKEWLVYGFAVNSARVDPAKGDIRAVVRPIERAIMSGRLIVFFPIEDQRLEVLGYSDCHGRAEINAPLREARADNFCGAVSSDEPFEDFFKFQILRCAGAPLDQYAADNATAAGRAKNRGVIVRVIEQRSSSRFPYDPTYGPNGANCAPYLLSKPYLGDTYAHNAFCACTHTPDDPHNNCVRKCLQEKMREFLAANADALRRGEFIWCPSIWQDHRQCYQECGCDNGFIAFEGFHLMCTNKFTCPTVGLSIAVLNNCMDR